MLGTKWIYELKTFLKSERLIGKNGRINHCKCRKEEVKPSFKKEKLSFENKKSLSYWLIAN